jgi:hypothetical protein
VNNRGVPPQEPDKAPQRLLHDVQQAHRLILALDAEKVTMACAHCCCGCISMRVPDGVTLILEHTALSQGVEPVPALAHMAEGAARGASDATILKPALLACLRYLWTVHGVEYFNGASPFLVWIAFQSVTRSDCPF